MDEPQQCSNAGPGPSSLAHHHAHQGQPIQPRRQNSPPQSRSRPQERSSEVRLKDEPLSSGSSQDAEGEAGANNHDPAKDRGKKPKGAAKIRRQSSASKDKEKEREKAKRVAACDVCRMRKVKCIKADDSPTVEGKAQRCQGCTELNRDCSYNYVSKKPGPPNPYVGLASESHELVADSLGVTLTDRYAKPSSASSQTTPPDRYAPYPATTPSGGYRSTLPDPMPNFDRHVSSSTAASLGINGSSTFPTLPLPHLNPTVAGHFQMSPPLLPFPAFLGQQSLHATHLPPDHARHEEFSYHSESRGMQDDFGRFGGGQGRRLSEHRRGTSGSIPPELHAMEHNSPRGMLPPAIREFSPAKSLPGSMNGFGEEDNLFMPWVVGATPPSFPPSTSGGGGSVPGIPHTPSLRGNAETDGSHSLTNWTKYIPSDHRSDLGGGFAAALNHDQDRGRGRLPTDAAALGLDVSSTFDSHGGAFGYMSIMPDDGGGSGTTHSHAHSHSLPGISAMPSGWLSHNDRDALGTAATPALMNRALETPVNEPYLEDVTSWSTIMTFLSLYHEHLYPLLPLMHWPSFSQQLIARHDRRDTVFRAFVLSLGKSDLTRFIWNRFPADISEPTVAYSILQLPRSVIPDRYSQAELLLLHKRCHNYSQKLQPKSYEPAELIHISTLYCDHIYLGSMGKDNAANVVLAEAMRLAIAMGLHDETLANNTDLNEIERETRRRVFWVLYGSDRTIAALISCPMLLSDEDVFVGDILAVDDDLITAAGAFPQPSGRTPVLAGFLHVTKIFRLLSRVLQLVRRSARPVDRMEDTMVDPRTLIQNLQNLLDDLPPALRINGRVEEPRNRTDTLAFDTCKANILVTQVLVRFAIYQFAILKQQGQPDQCLDELTEDVLRRLHAMSSESLAANGESIRHKVLFIASSLLNKYPSDNAGHDHVTEFLGVYNKILTNQSATGVQPRNSAEDDVADEMGPSPDPPAEPEVVVPRNRRELMREVKALQAENEEIKQALIIDDKIAASEEYTANLPPWEEEDYQSFYTALIGSAAADKLSSAHAQIEAPQGRAWMTSYEERTEIIRNALDRILRIQSGEDTNEMENKGMTSEQIVAQRGSLGLALVDALGRAGLAAAKDLSKAHEPAETPRTGLLTRTEAEVLLCSLVKGGTYDAAQTLIRLSHRELPGFAEQGQDLLLRTLSLEGNVPEIMRCMKGSGAAGTASPSHLHHLIVAHVQAGNPHQAVRLLHHLEAGKRILPIASYEVVIDALVQAPNSRAQADKALARDLFSHMRLVAHPTPSVALYTSMIMACADSADPQPERALDLLTEMQQDSRLQPSGQTFTAAILACCKVKAFYGEAFRLLSQLLDLHESALTLGLPPGISSGYEPSVGTFIALLEGAKRVGDLARARWIFAEHLKLAQSGGPKPVAATLTNLFQTYAAFVPKISKDDVPLVVKEKLEKASVDDRNTEEHSVVPLPVKEERILAAETGSDNRVHSGTSHIDHRTIVIPNNAPAGPQSANEALQEAQQLFELVLAASATKVASPTSPFSDVHVTGILVNAYMSVQLAHAPHENAMERTMEAWDSIWKDERIMAVDAHKTGWSYLAVLEKMASSRTIPSARLIKQRLTEVWEEYTAYNTEAERHLQVSGSGVRERHLIGLGPRQIERCYAAAIRAHVIINDVSGGLDLFKKFREAYSPQDILATYTQHPSFANMVRLSDPSEIKEDNVPPHLLFHDVESLHRKLVMARDWSGVGCLKWACTGYQAALGKRRKMRLQERVGTPRTDHLIRGDGKPSRRNRGAEIAA